LQNIDAVAARAEEFANKPEYRESFDYATARAVASLPILCELTIPFVKVGGFLVAMKAKSANDEFEISRSAIRQLAGANSLSNTKLFEKTLNGHINGEGVSENRTVVVMKKLSRTPKQFPRKFAQIKKNPL
jgi:16S rRNA (guanine527-N7)-methyltransferase